MPGHERVISADSHMMEPGDLWVERLDQKFRDDAPRVIKKRGQGRLRFRRAGPSAVPGRGRLRGRPQRRGIKAISEERRPGKRLRGRASQRMGSRRAPQGSGYRRRPGRSALHHPRHDAVRTA